MTGVMNMAREPRFFKPDMSNLRGKKGHEIVQTILNTPPSDHTELEKKVKKAAAHIMELQKSEK
jgi:hypothetical protein